MSGRVSRRTVTVVRNIGKKDKVDSADRLLNILIQETGWEHGLASERLGNGDDIGAVREQSRVEHLKDGHLLECGLEVAGHQWLVVYEQMDQNLGKRG